MSAVSDWVRRYRDSSVNGDAFSGISRLPGQAARSIGHRGWNSIRHVVVAGERCRSGVANNVPVAVAQR
jgi:hypothetical protein